MVVLHSPLSLTFLACCLAMGQPDARAQPDAAAQTAEDTRRDRIDQLVAALNDEDWATRSQAEGMLSALTDLEQLGRLITREGLSPEQQLRLDRLAFERFKARPRAAMGVQFGGLTRGTAPGVIISGTVGGFDSERVLRPGDTLLRIDGQEISSQREARPVIISYEPTQSVSVDIVRAGEPLTVTLRMGSFDQLGRGSLQPDDGELQTSWQFRRARLARDQGLEAPRAAPIPPVVGLRQFRSALLTQRAQAAARAVAQQAPVPAQVQLRDQLGGGQGRGAMEQMYRTLNVEVGGWRRTPTSDAAVPFQVGRIAKTSGSSTTNVIRMIQQAQAQIRENNRMLRNANLPAEQRAQLMMQNDLNREMIDRSRRDLQELRDREEWEAEQGQPSPDGAAQDQADAPKPDGDK